MQPKDILGSSSTILHPQKNKPCYYLRNDDIPGSRPTDHGFKTNRIVDNLNPKYKLPSCELVNCPPQKFHRDSFDVGDIKGTKVCVLFFLISFLWTNIMKKAKLYSNFVAVHHIL
jgi:hypothetical protein